MRFANVFSYGQDIIRNMIIYWSIIEIATAKKYSIRLTTTVFCIMELDLLNAHNMGDPRFAHGNTVKCLFDAYNKYTHTHMHIYSVANSIREQGVDPNADLLKGRKNIGENKKSPAPMNILCNTKVEAYLQSSNFIPSICV